ncbi:DUF3108 domain-containing protein [Dyadobacter psychrotolerans]|uniref:DUF3108 domain-containing protein n=1 Tax=Dyadobacter psychrotolerans TaxID=2541721 RepID=A0A4R5D9N5_9BACT|nr:DUF3108 domain-containing protein [Dyadobacter psychrotolerans]TDE10322.1 DUF3108 domain-containing protein [Dyadobacter psychrotolerans]
MKRIHIILLALFVTSVFICFKQLEPNRTIANKSFGFGERVEYRVHYGFINAAEARVEIAKNITVVNNRPCFKINVTGRTVGPFDLISRVRDTWRSYVDTAAILPHMFYQNIQENKYRKEQTTVFHHNKDMAVSSIKDESKTFNVPNNIHDIISGYFFLRTINFDKINEGEVIEVPTFFDGDVYKLRVRYVGKDVIKTKFGKTRVLRLNPLIPDNKLFKGEGAMRLWISDDSNKIPLKVQVELVIGSLEMDLKEYKGLKKDLAWF